MASVFPIPVLQLDRTVSLEQYGFVVAADALGQLIFSPIFGLIADRLDRHGYKIGLLIKKGIIRGGAIY